MSRGVILQVELTALKKNQGFVTFKIVVTIAAKLNFAYWKVLIESTLTQ